MAERRVESVLWSCTLYHDGLKTFRSLRRRYLAHSLLQQTQSPPTVSSTFTKTVTAHCVRLGLTFCHFVIVFSHWIHNRSLTKINLPEPSIRNQCMSKERGFLARQSKTPNSGTDSFVQVKDNRLRYTRTTKIKNKKTTDKKKVSIS